jgi:2-octaprenyl-6-methoxyphenol hydroxylase
MGKNIRLSWLVHVAAVAVFVPLLAESASICTCAFVTHWGTVCRGTTAVGGLENTGRSVIFSVMNGASITYDVVVVGGGPAGLASAIALAETGARTALIARRAPYPDNRTTALLDGSIDFLQALEVWPRCKDNAAALSIMRLVDDTGRLIRAPEVRFSCEEIGLDVFGYNIENRILVSALEARAAELSNLTRFDDEAFTVGP